MEVCRLCLRDTLNYFDWSHTPIEMEDDPNENYIVHEDISYKDCYLKYTQFTDDDSSEITQYICDKCALCISDFHRLVEKSRESKTVLEEQLQHAIKYDISIDDTLPMETDIDATKYLKSDMEILSSFEEIPVEPIREEMNLQVPETVDSVFADAKICVSTVSKELSAAQKLSERSTSNLIENTTINSDTSESDGRNTDDTSIAEDINLVLELQAPKTKKKPTARSKRKIDKKNSEVKKEKIIGFLCSVCSMVLKDKYYLQKHELTHDKNRERKEVCPKCGLKLFTKTTLLQHIKTHDANRVKRHKCDFCEKSFFNKGACNVHMRVHLGQMLQCPECPKQLLRQYDLDRHLLSHSQTPINREEPIVKSTKIKCKECNADVRTERFREHIAIHRNKPIIKCTLCDKDFFSVKRCHDHIKRYHKKQPNEFESLTFNYETDIPRRYSRQFILQKFADIASDPS